MFGITPTSKQGLLRKLRHFFGLSQPELARCLGISREQLNHAERGIRPLPLAAALPQAALTLAQQQVTDAPVPAEPADATALRRRQALCRHQADQLAYQLTRLQDRAALARRRLAALPALTTALTPAGGTSPVWLEGFAAAARTELTRSGSTAQALVQLRQAALVAEAAAAGQLLAALG